MRALLASLILSSVVGIKAELPISEQRETRFFHEPAACGIGSFLFMATTSGVFPLPAAPRHLFSALRRSARIRPAHLMDARLLFREKQTATSMRTSSDWTAEHRADSPGIPR